jgi:hypothetical protein
MDWIDHLAEALAVRAPSGPEANRLLAAGREVAHRVERKSTPLATFVVGMAVADRVANGSSYEAALDEALEVLLKRLPGEPADAGADAG